MLNMYALTVRLKIRPECIEDFMRELAVVRLLIEREPDCLRFDVLQNAEHTSEVLMVEVWSSRDHFEQVQSKRAYYAPYFARVKSMWLDERQLGHWNVVSPAATDTIFENQT